MRVQTNGEHARACSNFTVKQCILGEFFGGVLLVEMVKVVMHVCCACVVVCIVYISTSHNKTNKEKVIHCESSIFYRRILFCP